MAIKFKCSKCGQEINVKDEFAGKQGKCPACKSLVTVPSATPPGKPGAAGSTARPAPSPPKKAREEEVVEVETEEEDPDEVIVEEEEEVIEAEVEEDEPPRKQKKGSITAKPSAKRRRDEEEEDEEEEDRPRKKKGSITAKPAGKRRRDDDEDDEEDDEDDEPRGRRSRSETDAWQKARLGIYLNRISMWLYAGFWGTLVGGFFLLCSLAISGPGSAITMSKLLGYLLLALWVGMWGLSLTGYIFTIMTPGRNSEKILGITTTSLLGVEIVLMLVIIFATNSLISGAISGGVNVDLLRGLDVMTLFILLLEIARSTVFGAYLQAVGKTLRNKKVQSAGKTMLVIVPSMGLSIPLLNYLLIRVVASDAPTARGDDAAGGALVLLVFILASAGGFLFLSVFCAAKMKRTMRVIAEEC